MTMHESARALLIETAWLTIRQGLDSGDRYQPDCQGAPIDVLAQRACFVTLTRGPELRGCCGSVRAHQSLLDDVAENAWRTAFDDPRFASIRVAELPELDLDISVLSEMTPVPAASPEQVLTHLEAGLNGLMITDGVRRATFLPKVWQSLPDPEMFLGQLRAKAGFAPDEWPAEIKAWTYTTEAIVAKPLVLL